MKKIKLTESQVEKLLNEGSYDTIYRIYYTDVNNLKSGKGTLTTTELRTICNQLYDAIKGMGTDKPAITQNLEKCKNLHDFKNVRNKFYSLYKEKLLQWLDDDIDGEGDWNRVVLRPLNAAKDASTKAGHFKEVEKDKTSTLEQSIVKTFPCIKDTPGYKFQQDSGTDGIKFGCEDGNFGLKMDGTLFYYDASQSKYVAFEKKTECVGVKYSSLGEEITEAEKGLNMNPDGLSFSAPDTPGEKAVEPVTTDTKTADTTTTDTKTSTSGTTSTGGSVMDFQQKLKDAGFESVGSVDGRLGPKTAKAAMEFIKSKGLLSETDEVSLNEQISQNFKRFL